MLDLFAGKFELRIWLSVLLMATSLILGLLGDQATFVHPPENDLERLLTVLPAITYLLTGDRTTAFAMSIASYGAILAGVGYGLMNFLERQIFEPLYFKGMIRSKLREEKLFNHYINKYKS